MTFRFRLNLKKLRKARRGEGDYLLRTNLTAGNPDELWKQYIDVHLPTTDGRNLILSRYTQPEKDFQLLLHQLSLTLPEQPPPRLEELKKKCSEDL